jgi:hypothetical protein
MTPIPGALRDDLSEFCHKSFFKDLVISFLALFSYTYFVFALFFVLSIVVNTTIENMSLHHHNILLGVVGLIFPFEPISMDEHTSFKRYFFSCLCLYSIFVCWSEFACSP